MRSTLYPTTRIIAHAAAGALLVACTPEKSPDPGTRGGAGAATSVCQRSARGEAGDLALARCLATPELAPERSTGKSPVTVYFDRSGSMRGFLDPSYPTRVRTDYRSVIDRLVVGLTPSRGFSFGSELRTIEPTLATL